LSCGARTDLPFGAGDSRDGGWDADRPDVPIPTCEAKPPRRVDGVWTIESPGRTDGAAFYEENWDRVAVYGGGPVIASTHYDEPVVSVELEPPSSHELAWKPAHDGWQFAASAKDDFGDRVFVAGGWIGSSDDSDMTFEVSPVGPNAMTFRKLPQLPVELRSSAAAFDPEAGRLLLFGGLFLGAGDHRTWELYPDASGAAWQQLADAGGPDSGANAACSTGMFAAGTDSIIGTNATSTAR
jgi:hypothetical protein